MTPPDRRPVDPLPPPPGSFDRMLKTARARRRRQGAAVVSSAAALMLVASGAYALGSMTGGDRTETGAADGGTSSSTPAQTTEPAAVTTTATTSAGPGAPPVTVTSTTTASAKPPAVAAPPPATPHSSASSAGSTAKPIIMLRGHVTDPAGNPVANVLVQPGVAHRATYLPRSSAAATTDENGNFTIPCPDAPVYLSTWPLNQVQTSTSTGQGFAPAFFAQPEGQSAPIVPSCGQKRRTTALPAGATLTGQVQTVQACAPEATYAVSVWLFGSRERTVRLKGLHAGDTFAFNGLPTGAHTLSAGGLSTVVDVTAGSTTATDATFACVPDPGATGSPVPTGTPSATPTDPVPPSPGASTPPVSGSASPPAP